MRTLTLLGALAYVTAITSFAHLKHKTETNNYFSDDCVNASDFLKNATELRLSTRGPFTSHVSHTDGNNSNFMVSDDVLVLGFYTG